MECVGYLLVLLYDPGKEGKKKKPQFHDTHPPLLVTGFG